MLRSFFALSLAAAAVLAASACSDGGSTTSGSGTPPTVTPSEACASAAASFCGKISSCAPFFIELGYGDEATCEERLALNCASTFEAQGSNTTPAMTKACADALAATSCDDIFSRKLPSACDPEPGDLADGTACGRDSQCMSSQCKKTGDVCGICSPLSAAGGACTENDDCESGLACAAQCVAPGELGADCSPTSPCKTSLACSGGKCGEPVGAGESCDQMPQICDGLQGLGCNTMGVCQKLQLAGPGEACGLQGTDFVLCKAGGFCKTAVGTNAGTCLAPAADGAACDEMMGPHCLSGAICSGGLCKLDDGLSCN
jgi:hypothetical protein